MRAFNTFIYIGWHRHGNFGDDLLRDVWAALLPKTRIIDAPLNKREYWDRRGEVARGVLRAVFRRRAVLLGGGTAIGFGNWAQHLRLARRIYIAPHIIIAGAGASSSSDTYLTSLQEQDWQAWRSLGARTHLLGVRGPITRDEVATNWTTSGVIGDPALALILTPALWRPRVVRRNAIGISVGSQEGTRFDVGLLAEAMLALREELSADVIEVHSLAASDAAVCADLAGRMGRFAVVVPYADSSWDTVASIAGLRLFVSERLHGVVAGVATRTPTVMLSYASKSDDFWRSVASVDAVRPTDRAEAIARAARQSLDPSVQAAVAAEVSRLVQRFAGAIRPVMGAVTSSERFQGGDERRQVESSFV